MKLYLSGPMTGYPELNYPLFCRTALKLRATGYSVVNPAETTPPESTYEEALEKDLRDLVGCQGVALLPGWEDSYGAQKEVSLAIEKGLPVISVDAWLRTEPKTVRVNLADSNGNPIYDQGETNGHEGSHR